MLLKGFRIHRLALVIMLALMASAVEAGPVYQAQGFDQSLLGSTFRLNLDVYTGSGGPYSGAYGGGAFKGTIMDGALANTAFPTFCLEYNEHFSPGATYTATIETAAIFGGNGGAQGTAPNTFDPVSGATQFLYRTFLTGGLQAAVSGFSYSSQASYTALQTAIWSLEEESWGASLTTLGSQLKQWALNNADVNADYGVRAMNLWNGEPYTTQAKAQSQLIWVSVPEPSSMVLLVISLIAVAATKARSLS